MVIPLSAGGGDGSFPMEEIVRYKPLIGGLAAGYLAVAIMTLIAGNGISFDLLVCVAAASIACSQQGIVQCAMPFTLFSGVALIFDAINLISLLAMKRSVLHPGLEDAFSSNCPYDASTKLPNAINVTSDAYKGVDIPLPVNYEIEFPVQLCNTQWVVGNIALVLSVLLDVMATTVGCKIYRAARDAAGAGGLGQGLGAFGGDMGGGPAGAGGPGGFGGGGPGGFGGQGGNGGGRPAPGGAPAGPQVSGPRAGLFQGQGQTLGS